MDVRCDWFWIICNYPGGGREDRPSSLEVDGVHLVKGVGGFVMKLGVLTVIQTSQITRSPDFRS